MCGTDVAYGGISHRAVPRCYDVSAAISLRACYAKSSTATAYSLRACYAKSGTVMADGAICLLAMWYPVLLCRICYVCAMRSPVPT
eukprot:3924687-Rhodomonas_salina.1